MILNILFTSLLLKNQQDQHNPTGNLLRFFIIVFFFSIFWLKILFGIDFTLLPFVHKWEHQYFGAEVFSLRHKDRKRERHNGKSDIAGITL